MILDKIIKENLVELEKRKKDLPLADVKMAALRQPPPLDFALALQGQNLKLIAEVKKASPSKGIIRQDFDPVAIASIYCRSGAAAISVLTEEKYFLGKLEYLRDIKNIPGNYLPLLRKDFLHDPYQIYEARAWGADAVLLIAAILTPTRLKELLLLATELGMAALVEVHNEKELETALNLEVRIVGINNRDLNTFKVDLNTTFRLKPLIPDNIIVVSESGIHTRDDVLKIKTLGINAVLIGEALMTARDIQGRIQELLL